MWQPLLNDRLLLIFQIYWFVLKLGSLKSSGLKMPNFVLFHPFYTLTSFWCGAGRQNWFWWPVFWIILYSQVLRVGEQPTSNLGLREANHLRSQYGFQIFFMLLRFETTAPWRPNFALFWPSKNSGRNRQNVAPFHIFFYIGLLLCFKIKACEKKMGSKSEAKLCTICQICHIFLKI